MDRPSLPRWLSLGLPGTSGLRSGALPGGLAVDGGALSIAGVAGGRLGVGVSLSRFHGLERELPALDGPLSAGIILIGGPSGESGLIA